MNIKIHVASESHFSLAEDVCQVMYQAAQARGIGIARHLLKDVVVVEAQFKKQAVHKKLPPRSPNSVVLCQDQR